MRNFAKTKGLYQNTEQILVYVNLPLDENKELVKRRGRGAIWGEVDIDFLINLRKVLHKEIYQTGILNDIQIIEINSLEKLESFDPFFL